MSHQLQQEHMAAVVTCLCVACGMQAPGCEGSGMMMAFHEHLMRRLSIPQEPIVVRACILPSLEAVPMLPHASDKTFYP